MLLNDWWGVGERHWPSPLLVLLSPRSAQITLAISGGDILGGSYTPGKLFLPPWKIAPMAKAEASLNLVHFLLTACIHTYIYVYIFNINYMEDRAVFQTSNMSTYCTNRKQHCSNRSLKSLQTNQESGESSQKRRGWEKKIKIRPFPPQLAYPKSHIVSYPQRREMCASRNYLSKQCYN